MITRHTLRLLGRLPDSAVITVILIGAGVYVWAILKTIGGMP